MQLASFFRNKITEPETVRRHWFYILKRHNFRILDLSVASSCDLWRRQISLIGIGAVHIYLQTRRYLLIRPIFFTTKARPHGVRGFRRSSVLSSLPRDFNSIWSVSLSLSLLQPSLKTFFCPFLSGVFITVLGNVRLQVHSDRQIDHVPRTPCFPNLGDCVHYIRKGMFTKSDLQGIHVHVSNASYEIFFHSSIMTDTASAIVRQG